MVKDKVIEFKNVKKEYKLYSSDKKRFLGLFLKKIPYKRHLANNNISFSIERGDSVAILGRNGAGKSTMLKMITGVVFPNEGEIIVNGRVSALLELTAGFDPEFNGIENIYLQGQLKGMSNDEIKKLEQQIIDFADIGDYIEQPVRTYSSGMRARLGFSINVNIDPEILLIDETLSVGDINFSKKCKEKINEILSKDGVTVIYVTHSPESALGMCNRGIVLEKGELIFDGEVQMAIDKYYELLESK